MREIKFRAWFECKKKMVYNLGFDDVSFKECDDDLELGEIPSVWDKDCMVDEDGYEATICYSLMQYTGLEDKKGVKVYDGDIIEVVGPYSLFGEDFYFEKTGNNRYQEGEMLVIINSPVGVVARNINNYVKETNKGKLAYSIAPNSKFGKSPVSNYTLWNLQNAYKVVGNIHDNPELLEV